MTHAARTKNKISDTQKYKSNQLALDHIINLIPAHIYWKDKKGIYLGCSDSQAQSLGLKSGNEVVGKSDFDLPWEPNQAEAFRKNDLEVMKSKKPIAVEEHAVFQGKSSIVLSQKVPLIDDSGKVIGVLGVSFDITAEKEREKLQKAKEQAEERQKMMKLMAASVAHELRTPLMSVSLGVNHLGDTLPQIIEHFEKEQPKTVTRSDRMQSKIDCLLELSKDLESQIHKANVVIDMLLHKIDTNIGEAEDIEKLSASEVVKNAIESYPFNEPDKTLLKCKKGTDFTLKANAELTKHIFYNLIKNAIHYIKKADKGHIEIWTDTTSDKKYNIIHFKDTALGIPKDQVEHVFEAFFSKRQGGTGVGLAFCKAVMKSIKGDITVSSKEGKYTHFQLCFPKIKR